MTEHHFNRTERDFEDSAFMPRSSFDFDDEVANGGNGMDNFHFQGQDLDFDMMNSM